MRRSFYQKHTKHVLKYHLVTAEPPFTVKTITVCTKRGRKHSIQQFVALTLNVYQVCHCVSCCVKNGSCSYQA